MNTLILYQGQTGPVWQPTLTVNGIAPNLTGVSAASMKLNIFNSHTLQSAQGGGVFTIITATSGIVSYAWVAADTALVEKGTLQVSYTDTNSKTVDCDPWSVEIRPAGSPTPLP